MKKVTLLMRLGLSVCLYFSFFAPDSQAANQTGESAPSPVKCSQCQFENDASDRYCLNCSHELRAATLEDLKRLEELNRQREEAAKRSVVDDSAANQNRVRLIKKNASQALAQSDAHLSYRLYIPRIPGSLQLGDSKSRVIALKIPKAGRFEDNIWDLSSTGRWEAYALRLFFDGEEKLKKWEMQEKKHSPGPKENYPRKESDVRRGMLFEEVLRKWGDSDYKSEKNDKLTYSLTAIWYAELPQKAWLAKQESYVCDVFELDFDSEQKLLSTTRKPAEAMPQQVWIY